MTRKEIVDSREGDPVTFSTRMFDKFVEDVRTGKIKVERFELIRELMEVPELGDFITYHPTGHETITITIYRNPPAKLKTPFNSP